jgi:RNA polymerase sigma-70 factor (ECF subfamily)
MKETDFKIYYTEYAPRIYRVCLGYVNDKHRAEDLLQETFINVWKGLASFKQESSLNTWIFRIATNVCLRHLQKESKITITELSFQVIEEVTTAVEKTHLFLYKCIAELEETDRLIISLELEGLPQSEIADIVGLATGNVRVRIHRIKDKLTKKFKAHGKFD